MPFKSEKQRKWMWANDPEMAAKWEKEEMEESHNVKFSKEEMEQLHRDGKLEKDGHTYLYSEVLMHFMENIDFTKVLSLAESSTTVVNIGNAGRDDGPGFVYGNYASYKKANQDLAQRMGLDVVNFVVGDNEIKLNPKAGIPDGYPVSYADSGDVGKVHKPSGDSIAYGKYKAHIDAIVNNLGWELIDYLDAGNIVDRSTIKEAKKKRDYKAEYKKFQSSKKMKKYRAELNKYNRQKGTYGNGDKKDASHKGGKIVGFEAQSKNRGRREKSRLKKEQLVKMIRSIIKEEYQNGRNKMARKKVKETSKKANSKALKSKKSSVAQIKLYDLLPEEEKNKINQIMDDIDITDERVMSKFSPMIKEWEASVKGFTGISEFLKFSDKKLHGKMEKMSETIEEIGNHLEGIIGKISSKK